ncbi:helix-turn-helix transcriptional regulator [Paenibacillus sp. GCM10027626]|uniref:helix-turn-helix transcriptional regulator n=1 Tax=Paenibacillus sp. GCM10027626 TaxID=3273411 RepID=UPI00362621DD
MSNIHRIQWFDQQIRENAYPNSNDLAERFEISKRQAQRDIEYMENTLLAPIVYVAKHRGYVYEDQTYMLPSLYMTDEEKNILRFLVHRYRQYNYDNAEAVQRVAHLLERFIGEEETDIYMRLPLFEAQPQLLQTVLLLSNAIRESRIVQVTYGGKRANIRPLRLQSYYNTDYVAAYCESTGKQRMFRLEDLYEVAVTENSFDPAETSEAQAIKLARKPFVATIHLGINLHNASWNGYPARRVDGDNIYEIEFFDTDAFMQHLVTSSWAEILAPKWLKAKLINRCSDILKRIGEEERE